LVQAALVVLVISATLQIMERLVVEAQLFPVQ
jgi:hypothetical protein